MTPVETIFFIEVFMLGIITFIYAWQWTKQVDYKDMLVDKYNKLVDEYNQLAGDKNRLYRISRLLLFLYHKHREKHNRGTRKCKTLSNRIKVLESQLSPEAEYIMSEVRRRLHRKAIPGLQVAQLREFIKQYDKLVIKHKRASKHCERLSLKNNKNVIRLIRTHDDMGNLIINHNKSIELLRTIHNHNRFLRYTSNLYKNKWMRATMYLRLFAEYIKYLHYEYSDIAPKYYRKPQRKLKTLEEFVVDLNSRRRYGK